MSPQEFTSVLIAGLRSSLGASFALLDLVGSGRFTNGLTAALVLEYEAACLKSLPALNLTAEPVRYRSNHTGRGAPAPGSGTMNGFIVELPAELQAEVTRRASQKPGGASAWVADAVREKLAACAQLEYLETRAARGSRDAYEQVLAKVPAVEPAPGDERRSQR